MINYTINQISSIVKSDSKIALPNQTISRLVFDSRKVVDPNGVLFFCINSEKDNGHNYIGQLLKMGVVNFVVSESVNAEFLSKANFLFVNDTVVALQELAIVYRSNLKNPVIAITGSNGKTIIKEWLSALLSSSHKIFRSPKSYNSQIGVPLSISLADVDSDYYLIEAGISKVGEMVNLQEIIKPDYGIFTNIGTAHQQYFANYREKISEKLKLFKNVKTLVYRNDDSLLTREILMFASENNVNLFSWSTKNEDSNIFVSAIARGKNKTHITYNYNENNFSFSIPFTDEASIENALHCIAIITMLGFDCSNYFNEFSALKPVAMRMELKNGINNCLIINDSYNSDINSLEIALDFLVQQKRNLRRTLILSDIEQVKLSGKELYSKVAAIIKKYKIEKLIAIGSKISAYSNLFDCDVNTYVSTDSFLNQYPFGLFKSDAILIKGARTFEFEKISRKLEQKTHQTCLEVNLTAMMENLNYFKSKISKKTKVMAMVKAFSYGSGSLELASVLQYNNVDYLAVAIVDEGIELRKGGISLPIMVMNPEPSGLDAMVEFDLEPEVFNISGLQNFVNVAKRHGIDNIPVHIKLDTGMHRLGFETHQIDELTLFLSQNSEVKIKSVFTHLVGTDESCHDDFTLQQIDKFKTMVDSIRPYTDNNFICHVLNSAGIDRFPQFQFDMVRLGIGLYGGVKVTDKDLRVVSTLKTYISQIRNVSQTETVGYSRKGKLIKQSKIATIPIGYADGLNRKLGNGNLSLLVNGELAPIVGNICMDMCMIDVTGINVSEGDQVIVFGEKPTIFDLADILETIPYEILTSVSARVNRSYYTE